MRAATQSESCSLVILEVWEPSRSFHGEGQGRKARDQRRKLGGTHRGTGNGTYSRICAEQERPVCAAVVTAGQPV